MNQDFLYSLLPTAEYYKTLANNHEPLPNWLANYKIGDKVDLREVLSHRVLYYPGAYKDGQPIKGLNITHTLHTYLYADYLLGHKDILDIFENDRLSGYKPYDIIEFPIEDLMPKYIDADMCYDDQWNHRYEEKVCIMCIYERKEGFSDSHGAKRLALIYTNEDGFRVFNITFHPHNCLPPPFTLVLQDHGLGGNYDKWGHGGILERISLRYSIFPKYYIVGSATTPWHFSHQCDDKPMIGGMHRQERKLFKHIPPTPNELWEVMRMEGSWSSYSSARRPRRGGR